jgi:hypothetical protein
LLPNDWRFSGLLSGDPPTSTQPQARAKLGKAVYMRIAPPMQEKITLKTEKNIRGKSLTFPRVTSQTGKRFSCKAFREKVTGNAEVLMGPESSRSQGRRTVHRGIG